MHSGILCTCSSLSAQGRNQTNLAKTVSTPPSSVDTVMLSVVANWCSMSRSYASEAASSSWYAPGSRLWHERGPQYAQGKLHGLRGACDNAHMWPQPAVL